MKAIFRVSAAPPMQRSAAHPARDTEDRVVVGDAPDLIERGIGCQPQKNDPYSGLHGNKKLESRNPWCERTWAEPELRKRKVLAFH